MTWTKRLLLLRATKILTSHNITSAQLQHSIQCLEEVIPSRVAEDAVQGSFTAGAHAAFWICNRLFVQLVVSFPGDVPRKKPETDLQSIATSAPAWIVS